MKLKLITIVLILFIQALVPAFADNVFEAYETKRNEIIFTQQMQAINSIDPNAFTNTIGSFYPGLRGNNQLIIYTPQFGFRTNTNEFGTEAIVRGNTVTSLSGANSLIPYDGIVISGHGKAKKWIHENIIVGSKIHIDKANNVITAYVTSESFLYGAQSKIKEAKTIMEFYEKSLITYDPKKPKKHIKMAEHYLNKAQRDSKNVQKYSSLAIEEANDALQTSLPYRENELKGIWIRPSNYTADSIADTVDEIRKAGINNVFLETYFHGKTIYPSKVMEGYGFAPQSEYFVGFDPLKMWIEEAHKNGIKVHIWFESFYIGNHLPEESPYNIIAVKPHWANTTRKNYNSEKATPSLSEHNGYFIDPANPEVQDFLLCLVKEIINNYQPDGINLDYIRYPQAISPKYSGHLMSSWGYTQYARDEFRGKYGIDPVELTMNSPLWDQWCIYRQDKITEFVRRVSLLCKGNKTLLTTVIFPNRTNALETKLQDWKVWSERNYVDAFTPLFLTCDSGTINSMISDVIKNKSSETDLFAGLFVTFMGGTEEDLIKQIHETRKLNLNGVILFDYAHFEEKYVKTLLKSAFAKDSQCDYTISDSSIKTKVNKKEKRDRRRKKTR